MKKYEELIKNHKIETKEEYDFLEKVLKIIENQENIIKEVREYIEEREWLFEELGIHCKEIYEILDGAQNEENK